ncbi:MAG TPA: hypothetical protein DGT23_10645 [Micromonosporaceae bacterium]|nr:hypothetical protein [Micromonosporaceae bacterium]
MTVSAAMADASPAVPALAEPVLAAVIGPPGGGKSTVVAALAAIEHVRAFRLREVIRSQPHLLAGFTSSSDPLGWVSLEAVSRVLHAVFIEQGLACGASVVLLDNFPGAAGQLELLAEVAPLAGARLAVLEISAGMRTVVTRVAHRRVCLGCGPDPHTPAVPAVGNADLCGSCGATLSRRESDVPRLHGFRLARYSANLPEITELAVQRGIPHLTIDADQPLEQVLRLAWHALFQLTATDTPSADHSGSRP